jgi:hypothetical protein
MGFSATFFLKNSENLLERNLMRVGIGLGVLPILIYVLNLFGVPIDWRIYFALSLLIPAYMLWNNRKGLSFHFGIKRSDIYLLIVFLIFLFSLLMFLKGAFVEPWLEDGDPWDYAVTAKYISIFKTTSPPQDMISQYFQSNLNRPRLISNYNEPYPQAYPIILGLLAQTNTSVNWTLKFFNSLIISLALIFFYFFAREFTGSSKMALFSTFVLAAVPCFVSHFIYSQALAIMLFLPAFYAIERTKYDRRWLFVAVPIIASILMTQSSSAGMFGAIFFPMYWLGKAVVNRKFMAHIFLAGILGLLLSLAFWGDMIYKYTWAGTDPNHGDKGTSIIKSSLGRDVYTLRDFYTAPKENKIDNPVGLGPIVFVLAAVSALFALINFKSLIKTEWLLVSLGWVVLNFVDVNSANLPISINNHRAWSFLAIAVALFVSYGMWQILALFKKNSVARIGVISIAVVLIAVTSFYPKYVVNTVPWPTHYFASMSDIPGYMWLVNLHDNTPVTSLCMPDAKVIGMDKYSSKMWDLEQYHYMDVALNQSVNDIHAYLRGKGYQYVVFDTSCVGRFGINRTNDMLQQFVQSNNFQLIYPTSQEQMTSTFIFQIA